MIFAIDNNSALPNIVFEDVASNLETLNISEDPPNDTLCAANISLLDNIIDEPANEALMLPNTIDLLKIFVLFVILRLGRAITFVTLFIDDAPVNSNRPSVSILDLLNISDNPPSEIDALEIKEDRLNISSVDPIPNEASDMTLLLDNIDTDSDTLLPIAEIILDLLKINNVPAILICPTGTILLVERISDISAISNWPSGIVLDLDSILDNPPTPKLARGITLLTDLILLNEPIPKKPSDTILEGLSIIAAPAKEAPTTDGLKLCSSGKTESIGVSSLLYTYYS